MSAPATGLEIKNGYFDDNGNYVSASDAQEFVNSLPTAEKQIEFLQGMFAALQNNIAVNTEAVNKVNSGGYFNEALSALQNSDERVLGLQAPTDQSLTDQFSTDQSLLNRSSANRSSAKQFAYSAPTKTQTSTNVPSGYTGFWGGAPYAGGTVQTAGGGFYMDENGKMQYSAGYHGSGDGAPAIPEAPPSDFTGWWAQPIQGARSKPYIKGQLQTEGGGFTPDGSYSAGYHGSGEHPEITGESLPGDYKSGSFGSVAHPDLSNPGKVGDFLKYLQKMGYDVSDYLGWDKQTKMSNAFTGQFDGVAFMQKLSDTAALKAKTELMNQATSNPMMPTAQALEILGGINYSNLGENLPTTPGTTAYAPGVDMYGTGLPFAWTPAGAFAPGQSYGNNPTGPYPGWGGGNAASQRIESQSPPATAPLTGASTLTGEQTSLYSPTYASTNALQGANTGYTNLFGPSLLGINTIA